MREHTAHPHPGPLPREGEGVAPIPSPPEGERVRVRGADFTLNGRPCRTHAPSHWTVLDLLRDGLSLTGTKDGCGEGVCGACTVLLDGEPIRACLVLAARLAGRSLVTIEGLEGAALDPLQEAFARLGAAQCGFCTPGMILSARALLASNPAPGEGEVREALAGNLCRCTGYVKIVEAVLDAAARSGPCASAPSS